MVFNNKYYGKETEWNINQVFSEILKELIIEINLASLKGDMKARFNASRILYNNIHGHDKVNKKVMDRIDREMSIVLSKFRKLPENYVEMTLSSTQARYIDTIKKLLDNIHRDLIDEMYRAGLIFPTSKKDAKYSTLEIK